jgi:hypothetical protein
MVQSQRSGAAALVDHHLSLKNVRTYMAWGPVSRPSRRFDKMRICSETAILVTRASVYFRLSKHDAHLADINTVLHVMSRTNGALTL